MMVDRIGIEPIKSGLQGLSAPLRAARVFDIGAGCKESNSQPSPYRGAALPFELTRRRGLACRSIVGLGGRARTCDISLPGRGLYQLSYAQVGHLRSWKRGIHDARIVNKFRRNKRGVL